MDSQRRSALRRCCRNGQHAPISTLLPSERSPREPRVIRSSYRRPHLGQEVPTPHRARPGMPPNYDARTLAPGRIHPVRISPIRAEKYLTFSRHFIAHSDRRPSRLALVPALRRERRCSFASRSPHALERVREGWKRCSPCGARSKARP